ncbi:acetyl-CoA carboxylase biotin carboxyl carrier protein [Culicoidibacter larvae]|uniref:Biotin carboxyl carrier protein of acetyl-CoA carboxylase n=1 Tax=Culicoidibacter larvae TaxID=2579976 RepID=A0A5R8QGE2_9FIRM|nr:acetyl-CoA carboxylase biotin carboxyl carrier protein [Culicoidibacter larvae]TLG77068.1 acetyl-CoA carboxylase biotin carboxyl carrier protein [Culicoidibacter larvae]
MDIKKIKEVMDLFSESDLTAIEIAEKDTKIRLERDVQGATVLAPMPQAMPVQPVVETTNAAAANDAPSNKGKEVLSPLVGTFYSAASPTDPPFAKVGQKVAEGEVLCIIEAMKVMNEIQAPFAGTISKVCVENGDVIAFDQPIFEFEA